LEHSLSQVVRQYGWADAMQRDASVLNLYVKQHSAELDGEDSPLSSLEGCSHSCPKKLRKSGSSGGSGGSGGSADGAGADSGADSSAGAGSGGGAAGVVDTGGGALRDSKLRSASVVSEAESEMEVLQDTWDEHGSGSEHDGPVGF
jgi:hypothetical protein